MRKARRSQVAPIRSLSLSKRLLGLLARTFFRATARVTVEGGQDLPADGPLIVIGNHTSNADPPLVEAWLQERLGRPVQFMAKEQLFFWPLRPILRWYGAVPVRAGGSDVAAYRDGLALLRSGGVLGLFPEGTRSPDGRLGAARLGAALLATRSGVPVLPVGISGLGSYLPRGARFPHIGARVRLRIGRPETLVLLPDLEGRAALEQATRTLMERVMALVEAEHHRLATGQDARDRRADPPDPGGRAG
jgi:1-acyl-sn-glycerol-3-phosphate acyltransferase